jgi:rare lipoprotein A
MPFRTTLVLLLLLLAVPVHAGSLDMGRRVWKATWPRIARASWYGFEFAWRHTASGERFNPYRMTAAHRTLPFGTLVRVTNLRNGRSVLVTINDRGPFIERREIDLSYGAAREIGIIRRGIADVRIELVES